MKLKRLIYYTPILVLLLISLNGNGQAISIVDITYIETMRPEGWLYEYTVTNAIDSNSADPFNIYSINFEFNSTINVSIVDLPDYWEAITGGTGFVNTFSLKVGAPPAGSDIAPGQSLGGFVFLYSEQVGDISYSALLESEDRSRTISATGTTAAIPEPPTLLLVVTGVAGLGLLRRSRRRNKHANQS